MYAVIYLFLSFILSYKLVCLYSKLFSDRVVVQVYVSAYGEPNLVVFSRWSDNAQ